MSDNRRSDHMFNRFLTSAQLFEEPWRKSNQQCFEYCDGDQWTDYEREVIEGRGQQATVINTILPTVEMVCAVANERQCDYQVVGREGSDEEKAQLMTELLKHVFDEASFDYYHQLGFREAIIGGRSWFEIGVRTDERGIDMVTIDKIPWENVYLDPFSRKPDASDARFIIKIKWMDRDILKHLFPDKADQIDSSFCEIGDYKGQEDEAQQASYGRDFFFDFKSNRVRICECYYTIPEVREVEKLNERTGKTERRRVNVNAVHYVIFADDIFLQGSPTDHKANKPPLGLDIIPLVPMNCLRDRNGRPRGIVRNLIDLQDQINKLNSKFMWTLMTNRMLAEVGAVRDPEEAREQLQRPDGVVLLNDGGLGRVRIDDKFRDLSYMSNHLNFLLSTEQRISGVNDSMLGLGGANERSGVMQATRITQGAAMQTSILENMYFSKKRIAYVVLRLIGKFYTDYRVVRITQPNGVVDTYEFNKEEPQIGPDGQPLQPLVLNKIEDSLYYDVVFKKVQPFTTQRQQMLTIFAEVLKSGVIPAPVAAKIMLELSDIPNKEELLYQIEQFYQEQQAMAQQAAAQAPAQ